MKFYKYIHFLSLDVCMGALCYQSLFYFFQNGSIIPFRFQILLFCAIWMIYLIDRLIDVRIALIRDERHQFIFNHQFWVVLICIVLSTIGLYYVFQINQEQLAEGFSILLMMGVYWWAWIKKWFTVWLSKDLLTALIYVLGVLFPFSNANHPAFFALGILLFLTVFHHLKLFLHVNGKKCETFLRLLEVLFLVGNLLFYVFYPTLIHFCIPLWITLGVQVIIHYFYPSERLRIWAELAYWSPLFVYIYELF